MPNHIVLASGAVVAVGVAVATAVAIYESPEVRRYADDVRRRIAIALHSMGDNVNPAHQEPLFNRPEDADGFLESRRGPGAEDGMDADEEARRRQREELLYWNSVRMQKEMEKEKQEMEMSTLSGSRRGSNFEDFLRPDETTNEPGTFVFNTGADVRGSTSGLRHRSEGPRGFSSLYTNPFADEHHIDADEMDEMERSHISPTQDEVSDIYSATTREGMHTPPPMPVTQLMPPLIPVPGTSEAHDNSGASTPPPMAIAHISPPQVFASPEAHAASVSSQSSLTLDRELGPDEFVTAGQDDRDEAYASIQAWAQNSSRDFYSPLPVTPTGPVSEPELLSDGQLTPTDSISIIGSNEAHGNDTHSFRDGESGRYYDVMSESSGMATPASWSEVGSVISESDAAPVRS